MNNKSLLIQRKLISLKNKKHSKFISLLTPNVDKSSILGIKNPILRKIAKEYINNEECKIFMRDLPHKYFEENILHSLLINEIKDYKKVIKEINIFLPYINNWAVCDILSPKKAFKNNKNELIKEIYKWIRSKHPYTIRFGIEMLMAFYLDEYFKKEYLNKVSKIRTNDYYVNMMIAWFFATALAKQYKSTIPYIRNKCLEKWVHNKTIQKSIESFRISENHKSYLRSLKIK